jgi:hypothetical protein
MDSDENQSADTRQKIYQDLHSEQLSEQEAANAASATRILDILIQVPFLRSCSLNLDVVAARFTVLFHFLEFCANTRE